MFEVFENLYFQRQFLPFLHKMIYQTVTSILKQGKIQSQNQ